MGVSVVKSFTGYISKVFSFHQLLNLLNDTRDFPQIDIARIFKSCFYGFAFGLKSIKSIEDETVSGAFQSRIGFISDDSIKYGLEHLDRESVQQLWNHLCKRIKRNGVLRDCGEGFDDYIVAVLDGIETYCSANRQCPRCKTRKIRTGKGKKLQYYHQIVVLTLVGYDFSIPIGIEMVEPGEGEVSSALRLLERLVNQLGKRFIDIVIGDAAYCTPRFFRECEAMGLIPGAVLKKNQLDLLESATAQKKQIPPCWEHQEEKEKLKLWDLKDVIWDTANKEVRVIYADREVYLTAKKAEVGTWVEKKRVFVFSKKMDHLRAGVAYKMGIHRWDIDASLFMNMVKHWHLKHQTLHFKNAYENLLNIRFISYMIFMLFHIRHINSRRKNRITSHLTMAKRLHASAIVQAISQIVPLE